MTDPDSTAHDLLKDLEFPQPPSDERPQDGEAVRLLVAGQRGQGLFYEALGRLLRGDLAFLARLLMRDWQRRFGALMRPGRDILNSLHGGREPAELPDPLPGDELIQKVVASLVEAKNGLKEPVLMALIREFAANALVATQLVPWKADSRDVYEYFVECVEAEDQHLELIAMLTDLVGEETGPGPEAVSTTPPAG